MPDIFWEPDCGTTIELPLRRTLVHLECYAKKTATNAELKKQPNEFI